MVIGPVVSVRYLGGSNPGSPQRSPRRSRRRTCPIGTTRPPSYIRNRVRPQRGSSIAADSRAVVSHRGAVRILTYCVTNGHRSQSGTGLSAAWVSRRARRLANRARSRRGTTMRREATAASVASPLRSACVGRCTRNAKRASLADCRRDALPLNISVSIGKARSDAPIRAPDLDPGIRSILAEKRGSGGEGRIQRGLTRTGQDRVAPRLRIAPVAPLVLAWPGAS